jgi:hypothetical protein
MPSKQPDQPKLEVPSLPAEPGGRTSLVPIRATLLTSELPSREIQAIAKQLQIDVAKQEAVALKHEYGIRLVKTISLHTLEHFDAFVAADRAIREKKRPEADQADMEVFCHAVRQAQATSLLAIRQAAVQTIETIVMTSLNPPAKAANEVIVEEVPSLFARLFGGQKVTRIQR